MEMNSYEALKNHLFEEIQKLDHPLPPGAIESQIQSLKKLLSIVSSSGHNFAIISPSLAKVSDIPSDFYWDRMQAELETLFNVYMADGILIQGKEYSERDKFWWTKTAKDKLEAYYWRRYSKELLKILNRQVRDKIDDSTDVIMDSIGNPTDSTFERRGMVVGHVQSGKTANYSSLVCKAADAGYKFIVVIAGDKTNLRNQTQKRLNEHFVGWNGTKQVGVGIGRDSMDKRPISLTGLERDFNKRDADTASQGSNFDNVIVPILLVVKKDTRTLTNVTSWLKNQYKNKISDHAMLLIDDESDYASINTREENSPTKINEKIRELLSLFEKRSYVAYTATPYANILIDHQAFISNLGEDLFPKDFIYALDAPDNYFGARKVFIDNDERYVVQIDDYVDILPLNHKKDWEVIELPPSLKEAIRLFILNVSIRDLRGFSSLHNSMMIHATRFTQVHQKIKLLVQEYLDHLVSDVLAYGNLETHENYSKHLKDFKDVYEKYCTDKGFSWPIILKQVVENVETLIVREVHQKTLRHVRLEYNDLTRTNAIVIGGASISRGYTLEGLSVSYFLRGSIYYDTLMQMGRWFGYRPGYEDLCKIFMPRSVKDNFTDIIESTIELFEDFRQMSNDNMTPEEFGLAVKYRPESALQVTARNKQRNAQDLYIEMKLDGLAKETARIHKDASINHKNKESIRRLIEIVGPETKKVGNGYVWQNVQRKVILNFLQNYEFITYDQYTLNMRMPVDFIKQYVSDVDTPWDIALYSGNGKEESLPYGISILRETRQLEKKDHSRPYLEILRRQVSSGAAERITLEDGVLDELKAIGKHNNRQAVRAKLPRPLLMLHFLQLVDDDAVYPALGFSFPAHINSSKGPIRLKINSVYAKQLQEELDYEEEQDD